MSDNVRKLFTMALESEKTFYSASENVQNRGLKLLLKAYAQQREEFALDLHRILVRKDQSPPGTEEDPVTAISRGLVSIQAAMTLGRSDRERVVLEGNLKQEERAKRAYEEALAGDLIGQEREIVEEQHRVVQRTYAQLQDLAESGPEHLTVRLFDREEEAEQTLSELRSMGVEANRISVTRVEQVPIYRHDDPERKSYRWRTTVAGAAAGAVVGAVVGLAVVLYQIWISEIGFVNSVGPVTMILTSGIIGALFGVVFGLLIGQGTAEEDAYVYAESLRQGDTLIAVWADQEATSEIKQAMGLHHEREV